MVAYQEQPPAPPPNNITLRTQVLFFILFLLGSSVVMIAAARDLNHSIELLGGICTRQRPGQSTNGDMRPARHTPPRLPRR